VAVLVVSVVWHAFHCKRYLRPWHTLLRMTQEDSLDTVIRQRIRGLRLARNWSLDTLAAKCFLSASTLSRIETGHRRIALDQLVPIARALGTTLDQLVEPVGDEDVVIRPEPEHTRGRTVWLLSNERMTHGETVAKMRITAGHPVGAEQLRVHPGREWFFVLAGTVRLRLGERTILVQAGSAAEFSTMVPHAIDAQSGAAEILTIFDHEGERAHLHGEG
jgi:transcriptional regulator with XRE-family HTH domain